VLSLTMDNVSNNDMLTRELEELIPSFRGDKQRTRCFAHMINLVTCAFLRLF
ncbi:hypothetical protein BDZ89DRAFT_901093, partial [Hymenopellis radicata]